jgi:anaerobic ribonucleoside-triphosphate reductase activating protein
MNYGKIKPVDVANGEGVRVSLFVSGCPHHCKGCFNYELWDYNAGKEFTPEVILDILDLCSPDYISGLSLLGGEPLDPMNIHWLTVLCHAFKKHFPNKTIWCYTGYNWYDVEQLHILKYIDVLVDGQFIQNLADPRLRFRGSSNQRIIDVKKSLASDKIYVRKELMGE